MPGPLRCGAHAAILAGPVTVASVLLLSGLQLGRSLFAQLVADRGYAPAVARPARLADPIQPAVLASAIRAELEAASPN